MLDKEDSSFVVARGLSKRFEDGAKSLLALDGVSLTVRGGEFVSIVGPSGCGKTTLLRLIGGLLAPTAGSVAIAGKEPAASRRRKEIGYVFQEASLLPWRNVAENVHLPLEVNHSRNDSRRSVDELLALVGLEEFAAYYPRQLSGGMQQRAAIARALVFGPSLLLMDEPFGALDEITRESLRFEFLRIRQSEGKDEAGRSVVFVTHSVPEAVLLSDRVVVLSPSPGRVVASVYVRLARPREEGIETTGEFLECVEGVRALLRRSGEMSMEREGAGP